MRFSKEKREAFNKSFYELLDNSFKNINEKDEKGETILHKAARMSTRKKVSFLVKKGAEVNARDNKGFTPLHWAVSAKRLENVKELIRSRAEVNATEGISKYTPLHLACMVWAERIIKELVKAGAAVNQPDKFGNTPMHWLLDNEKNKEVKKFLEKQGGVVRDRPEICDEIVESVGEMVDVWSRRFLPKLKGKVVLKAISEENINGKDSGGCTALHRAAQVSNPEVIKLLIEKGAGINDRNNRGETALHLAAFLGKRKNVKALIEGGATVNAKSNNKAVPLHLACLARRIGTIEELINAGGDLDTVDKFGCSPLNYAKIYPKVTSYLEKKGVNMRDVEVMYGEANKAIEEIMERCNKGPEGEEMSFKEVVELIEKESLGMEEK
ncbi:ankyrin repeat-containing protein [Trichonephila clavata]|uniref:Ankyrin repeat-containing protein n=2 Tax=Trichonephila clavata TaxID=2740835 RepID=A0A8X6LH27_TRICU|nr:ankyrin repeat-containing protein [Trichonephila clavata]GFR06954.1 ankyrin repeat-containing protein [Trichonephila clavata]